MVEMKAPTLDELTRTTKLMPLCSYVEVNVLCSFAYSNCPNNKNSNCIAVFALTMTLQNKLQS